MRIPIDDDHVGLVEKAVAEGRATDAQAYLQSLIEGDAAEQWVSGHQEQIESLLRDRIAEQGVERQPGDFDTLRQRVLALVEKRRDRRSA